MAKRASWQLQHAKNRLSEVVEAALSEGPQIITRRGADTAVVISFEEWSRLSRPRGRLIDLLRKAPRVPGGLAVVRQKDLGRDVEL